ncbi:host specificity protein J [Acinetobacter gerneri]|uniref:host specificity protein J n=1 Tax=Acinetobacter gerneri TaxID=202952 RepID=UPI0028AF3BA9|nr:phage tail protein [Acinetobacter gerneri]
MQEVIKGEKAGSGKTRTPVISPDTAQSRTYIKALHGLSWGEIKGIEDNYNLIYVEDTPLQDANGAWNFQNITVETRNGTNDQDYIQGFPDVTSETQIGVELKNASPWVKAISNLDLDAVSIRFRFDALKESKTNGDIVGTTVEYAVDLQTDGGAWVEVVKAKVADKTSPNYERQHRIELPKADHGWQIRARRITPDSTSDLISDKMHVWAMIETIDAKLAYPNIAQLFLQYDAETFGGNIAKVSVRSKGVMIPVASNYDPETRKYNGLWDGTFKFAYTDNNAWHFLNICLNKEYGLGDRLDASMVDKWSVYQLAQYCDELVPDGKGGFEPRFTLNVYLQSQEDAWSILQKIAASFRAFIFWDGQRIQLGADVPQDSVYTYTSANIIGLPEYTGTAAEDRHNVIQVNWDNPNNRYKTEPLFVREDKLIATQGIKKLEIDAWGVTSEGQAQRAGQWALKSEKYETRTVTFKVGLDALVRDESYLPQVGRVIELADPLFAGRDNGGRIVAVSKDLLSITLDRDDVVCRAGDRLVVNGDLGKSQARVVSKIQGRVITVVAPFDPVSVQNVWAIDAQDLATMKFRVVSITLGGFYA